MLEDGIVTLALAQCGPTRSRPSLPFDFSLGCVLEHLATATSRSLEEIRPKLDDWPAGHRGGIARDWVQSGAVGSQRAIAREQLVETLWLPQGEWAQLRDEHLPGDTAS